MNHLTPDELIDAAEGTLDPSRLQHLATCTECARQVADLASVIAEARAVEVPEPSPLFWGRLSARVREAVEAEPARSGRWAQWLRWPVLVPIGALAVILFALTSALPRQGGHLNPAAAESIAADVALSEDGWRVVADLVGDIDWETADAAGVMVRPGLADQAALELTAQEQRELGRLLMAELERVKS